MLACLPAAQGGPVISEFLAANEGGLEDRDGDTPAWIEIHNDSAAPVNLGGWHLTDSPTNLTRWTFPATNLPAGGYLVVFASGKNRITGPELHTNFRLADNGEFLALVMPDGATVAHAYGPAYPPQKANVAYGVGRSNWLQTLAARGAMVRYYVPSNNNPGLSWVAESFDDSQWPSAATGLGYAPGGAGSTNGGGGLVLRLDFNDDDSGETGAANTEEGFAGMTLSNNPAVINGVGIELTPLGGASLDDRDRATPVDAPPLFTQDQLYDDFIFVNGQTNGNGLRLRLTNLPANESFQLRIWSFDSGSPNNRVSDWIETASGVTNVLAAGYTFNGSNLPAANYANTFTASVRSSASGVLQIEARRNGGTSHGVFLNALELIQDSLAPLIATDLGPRMSNRAASVYARLPFVIEQPAQVQNLALGLRYDDGLVVWLNGQPVAVRNAPALPAWNSTALSNRPNAQVITTEWLDLPLGLLHPGTNLLAFQGLNVAAADADFLLLPELEATFFTITPPRYLHPPTPGAPNGAGYEGLVADTKFSADRGFYDAPFTVAITTATANAAIYFTTDGREPSPAQGTLYTGPVPITNTTLLRAAAFRPGFFPSDVDTHSYIFLDSVLRQPAMPPGYPAYWQANYPADYGMDPEIVAHPVYGLTLANDLRAIPTLSIVTDHNSLWHSSTGIYVNAVSAGEVWERSVSAELMAGDNATEFQLNCRLRMQGNASRDNVRTPKHSFRLLFKSDFGPAKLRYPWFGEGPVNEFDNLVLRACFTDAWTTRYSPEIPNGTRYRPEDSIYLRDVWMKDSQRAMGWLSARNTFAHLYVNGLYWGLYNPCERLDASFFASHAGGREGDWDVIRDFTELLDGNLSAWNELMALLAPGITNEAAYQEICRRVEVENLADYMLLHFHAEAEDWPHHNWYAAHRRATNGLPETKWIFCVWDQEIVMDQLVARDRLGVNNTNTPAFIYARLRQWPEFRRLFGDRAQKHLFNGGALTVSNSVARLRARAAEVERAIVGESARWGDARKYQIVTTGSVTNKGTGVTFTRDEWWRPEIDKLCTNWLPAQTAITLARLRNAGLYPPLDAPVFNVFGGAVPAGFNLEMTHSNLTGAILFTLDGSDPRVYGSGAVAPAAQTYELPVPLNAPALARARVWDGANWSALVEAMFYPPQDLSALALTEIMYNPLPSATNEGSEFEFIELKNTGATALNLSGLMFSGGVSFAFSNGFVLAPGAFAVLARNATAFAERYPGVALHGLYSGRLDNAGERLTLSHPAGGNVFSLAYGDRAPWPAAADGWGFSLVPRAPGLTQAPDDGAKWRASALPGGSPGADDPEPFRPRVVINEILTASVAPQTDTVELRNLESFPVSVGGWFLTDDAAQPRKYRLPDEAVIPALGYLTLAESHFNPTPGTNQSFSFSAEGEEVYLFGADAEGHLTGYSHGFSFGAAAPGVTFGRHVTSVGEEHFPAQDQPTLGAENVGPRVGPVVLSEIMYHPPPGGSEFVELKNITSQTVLLYEAAAPSNTWRLGGLNYVFPGGLSLPPEGRLLLTSTNEEVFRAYYAVPAEVPILGPVSGVLQNSGERLTLLRPETRASGVAWIVVDEVRYNDQAPWPAAADGAGPSLQRRNVAAYGNDPLNWMAAPPTPGRANLEPDSDGDGLPDAWETSHGLVSTNQADAALDSDGDGHNNLAEYLAGTNPFDAASVLRVRLAPDASGGLVLQFSLPANRPLLIWRADQQPSTSWQELMRLPAWPEARSIAVPLPGSESRSGYYRLEAILNQ